MHMLALWQLCRAAHLHICIDLQFPAGILGTAEASTD